LAFNEAHWSFFKPNADATEVAKKFQSVIDRFDRLSFDAHGADVAHAYTLHERDAVFPCYEYADVATSEMVLNRTPQLRSKKTIEYDTRRIILSACYGFIGWADLKADRRAEGLARLKRAIVVYPHGLPVHRLYFDALLHQFLDADSPSKADASDLADAFIAVVNINPSILLTHVFVIVPLLADNGERRAAKDVIAAWYRLANIVHSLRSRSKKQQSMDVLWNYRSLFPTVLTQRIEAALKDDARVIDLTQLEAQLVEAARRDRIAAKTRKLWPWRSMPKMSKKVVAAILAENEFVQDHIVLSSIGRGFSVWLGAPLDVKILYMRKAWQLALRGEIKEVFLRVQQWSSFSKWSKGEALNAAPRPGWQRIVELFERLLGRKGDDKRGG
jgi:hypothetical protein